MKKYLVGVLAVLMLFAFTACDQGVKIPLAGDNEIAKVTVVSAPTFYAGSDETSGAAVVDVERVNGTTTKGIEGVISVTGGKVTPGTNSAIVGFGAITSTSSVSYENSYSTTVEAVEVTSLEINLNEKQPETVSVAADVVVDSAYGVYSDGTKVSLNVGTDISRAIDKETSSVVYTLAATKGYSASDVKTSVSVTLTPATPAIPTELHVYYTVNSGNPAATAGTVYYNDTVSIKIMSATGAGGDAEIEDVTSQVRGLNGYAFSSTVTVGSNPVAGTVAYNGLTASISVSAGANYVTDVSEIKSLTTSANKFTPGATTGSAITVADFEAVFTRANASDTGESAPKPTLAFVGTSAQGIPSTATAGSSFSFYMSATYSKRGVDTTEYFWVPVTVVAATSNT